MLVLSSCIHVRLLCDCLAHVYYVRLSRTRILCAIVSHTYICDPIASTHVSHSALLFHLLGSRLFATITCGDIAHVYRRSDRETIACVNDQCTFRAVYVRCYRTQLSLSLYTSLSQSLDIPVRCYRTHMYIPDRTHIMLMDKRQKHPHHCVTTIGSSTLAHTRRYNLELEQCLSTPWRLPLGPKHGSGTSVGFSVGS
jgi:hypothetical protein